MRFAPVGLGRAYAGLVVSVVFALTGCASLGGEGRTAAGLTPPPPADPRGAPAFDAGTASLMPGASLVGEPAPEPLASAVHSALTDDRDGRSASSLLLAQTSDRPGALANDVDEFYDPWEGFNESMFNFNLRLDRWVLKPAANVYRHVMPEPFQILIARGFDNIAFVPRLVNNLLQGKLGGAGRELARFLINSTAGIGGIFDPAGDYWDIKASKEDFGQTLGVWGSGPGPYLVLPLLNPMTVRDGIGRGVDSVMDPLVWVLPLLYTRLGMKAGDVLNERALNYELFQGVEETTIDLYSAVRHFYLKRREQVIKE